MPHPSLWMKLIELRHSRWFAPWRVLLCLLVAMTIWGLLDVRRRGYAYPESPGEHKSDLTVYTGAGAAFFDGRPPYEVCNPRGWTYVYPPMLAIALAPLHVLPMHEQVTVWFFICLLMCWGSYKECRRIVAFLVRDTDSATAPTARLLPWLGVIALATAVLPTLNCLQRGQVTIVIFYFLVLGVRLLVTGATHWAHVIGGIVLAVPVAIKIVPILPIAVVLFMQMLVFLRARWQRSEVAGRLGRCFASSTFGLALGLVLFFLVLPAALIGWKANLRHLDTWADLVLCNADKSTATPGFETDTHSVRNQCLGNALYRLGNFGEYMLAGGPEDPFVDEPNPPPRLMDAPSVNTCLLLARIALLCALLLAAVGMARHRRVALSQAAGFGLACVALLVVSPVARNHYFILLAPGALFVPLWLDQIGRRSAAVVFAVVPGVLILLQYVLMPYVGRVGLLGLGTTAWLMAAMVLMTRVEPSGDRQPDRLDVGSSGVLSRAA